MHQFRYVVTGRSKDQTEYPFDRHCYETDDRQRALAMLQKFESELAGVCFEDRREKEEWLSQGRTCSSCGRKVTFQERFTSERYGQCGSCYQRDKMSEGSFGINN